jgi:hypothetical protein
LLTLYSTFIPDLLPGKLTAIATTGGVVAPTDPLLSDHPATWALDPVPARGAVEELLQLAYSEDAGIGRQQAAIETSDDGLAANA